MELLKSIGKEKSEISMYIATTILLFNRLSFKQMLQILRELGLDGFELPHPIFYEQADWLPHPIFKGTLKPNSRTFREEIKASGLKVFAVDAENDFVQKSKTVLKRQVSGVKACIDTAVDLDCNIVRIFGGNPKSGISVEQSIRLINNSIKELVLDAEDKEVFLALENDGYLTNDYNLQLKILEEINSEYLKLNIDTGNYYWYGYTLDEVENILSEMAENAIHTHLKNARTEMRNKKRNPGEVKFTLISEGDINLVEFVRRLKKTGYRGALSLEDTFEGCWDVPVDELKHVLRKDIVYLKRP